MYSALPINASCTKEILTSFCSLCNGKNLPNCINMQSYVINYFELYTINLLHRSTFTI